MKYLKLFNEDNKIDVDGWQETESGLYKKYEFTDFKTAMQFMFDASEIINKENHHPKWTNEYNIVQIWLSTHDSGNNITEKDYDLAKKIDSVIEELPMIKPGRVGIVELTNKEKSVLSLLKQGKSYQQIADELGVSFFTVNFHIKNLYKKFGVNSNIALIAKKLIY
jgi:4a-hydroxytetrahydrobiopterin dehydratase